MMKKILLVAAIMLIGVMLFAQHEGKRKDKMKDGHCDKGRVEQVGKMKMGENMPKHCDMKLSEKQQEQVDALRYNHRLEMITLKADVEKLRMQVQHNASQGKFADAKKFNDQLNAKRAEISKKNLEMREKVYNLLTDEQKAEYRKSAGKHCGKHQD